MNHSMSHPTRHSSELLVGLDIGGTKTAALIADRHKQEIYSQVTRPTETESQSRLVEGIATTVQDALAAAGADWSQVAAVGAGVPGLVDNEAGTVGMAVNLHLDEPFPLREHLADRFDRQAFPIPLAMENDVRTAALGAYQWLQQREEISHMAYLSVGTGIAAGLILEGQLYRGARGLAGEIGHVVVQPDGPLCQCGARGCLETVAAGPAIARFIQEEMAGPGYTQPLTSADVYQQARQGNAAAQEIVAQTAQYLAQAIHWLVMAYDVEKVLIGGGVTRAGEAFMQPLVDYFSKLRGRSKLARFMMPENFMGLLPAGYSPGTWGAIALAKQALEQKQAV